MICGALQTLNEEAFEDVVGSELPSPTGAQPGELTMLLLQHQQQQLQQQLAPIRESVECGSITDDATSSSSGCGTTASNGFLLQDHSNPCTTVDHPLPTVIIMPAFVDDTRL